MCLVGKYPQGNTPVLVPTPDAAEKLLAFVSPPPRQQQGSIRSARLRCAAGRPSKLDAGVPIFGLLVASPQFGTVAASHEQLRTEHCTHYLPGFR
jgi:hypothetical protein